jgi:hypothetical protein
MYLSSDMLLDYIVKIRRISKNLILTRLIISTFSVVKKRYLYFSVYLLEIEPINFDSELIVFFSLISC